jgi:hypothetical protein
MTQFQTPTNTAPVLHRIQSGPEPIPDPVLLLSPPLSPSSFVCAMLGQHQEMYSVPETHLFLADTLSDWWGVCVNSSFDMAHGLLRVVAQLYFGEQTEATVQLAGAWLRRRLPFTTGYIIELLAEKVRPRMIVEKSPSVAFHVGSMERARRMFPQARFIHLVQHPQAYCRTVLAAVEDAMAHQGRIPQWLRQLACFSAANADELSQEQFDFDPQQAWCVLNNNICEFFETMSEDQKLRVRIEDVVTSQDSTLRAITEWLGLRADNDAIEAMRHPERSPYACFGPVGARYGDNPLFLRSPILPAPPTDPDSLEAPLSWRQDGEGLSPEVRALARQFGYE